jgi:N-acetylneuraminate synthase
MSVFHIAGRSIGLGHPPYVIAEMSGNHNGDIERAFALLDAAKASGADAVKMQTYTADTITIPCDDERFVIRGGLWDGRTLHDLYTEAHTPWEWHAPLFQRARDLGLTIFSSPFDHTAVDLLEGLDAPAYKIASFELVDLPLIKRVARTGKPMIMSTGMANLGEIAEAVAAARGEGAENIVLLHCVSGYPSPAREANLRTIPHMAEAFGVSTGLSDHTLGIGVSVAAVALGASVIEKHFTLRRADGGPDCAFSLEPEELSDLVRECRVAWEAKGGVTYQAMGSEAGNISLRRSLFVVAPIRQGECLTSDNIRSIRPGHGLAPKYYDQVIGYCARRDLPMGTPLSMDLIEPGQNQE